MLICSLAAVAIGVASQAHPQFMVLGDLPGGAVDSEATAIALNGAAIYGRGKGADGDLGFVWTKEKKFQPLPDLGGGVPACQVNAVSSSGRVVVGQGYSLNGLTAMIWSAGSPASLGDFPKGPHESVALGVSAAGNLVVGRGTTELGSLAFTWTRTGGLKSIGDLPGGKTMSVATAASGNGGIVVGYSESDKGVEGFLWTPKGGMRGLGDLPGGVYESRATGIAENGRRVIGTVSTSNGVELAYWTFEDNRWRALGMLPHATVMTPKSISKGEDVIVGVAETPVGNTAFVWTMEEGVSSLKEWLVKKGTTFPAGFELTSANAISADGLTIAGGGINNAGRNVAWVAILPASSRNGP